MTTFVSSVLSMDATPYLLNKPTAAVHISNSYTATERKLLNICLFEGVKDNFASELYAIDVWEALNLLGCDKSKNSTWLKNELFEALREKPIRWNVLKKDRSLQEWTCSLLAGYVHEPEEGKLAFQLNPMVVKYFKQRKLYSKLLLQIQAPIKSSHALTLYEFLNDELHRRKVGNCSITLPLAELRMLMDIDDGQYQQFKYLNSQAIKPAFAEINRHTDIEAIYEHIREKRSVVAIKVTAKRKQNFQLPLNLTPAHTLPVEPSAATSAKQDTVTQLLQAYGIEQTKALQLVSSIPTVQIVENIKYCLNQQHKIQHLPSYLISALEKNYSQQTPESVDSEALKEQWLDFQNKQAVQRFEHLSLTEQQKLRKDFQERLQKEPELKLTRNKFQHEGGWESRWVQHDFQRKVLKNLLKTPQELDLEAFVTWWPEEEARKLLTQAQKGNMKHQNKQYA